MTARSPFDAVAAYYDAGRPGYPDGLYAALETAAGPLAGALVLDAGAGTGIATRQLAARGARAIALDVGEQMLRRAQARNPATTCVLADGNALPIRSGSIDLACFAQSWHWFDPDRASWEVARVLRPGGHWAAWWSYAWADGEPWFESHQRLMESACPGWRRHHRNTDWSQESIAHTGLFDDGARIVVPWTRVLDTAEWMTEERSKSYVAELPPADRDRLLHGIGDMLSGHFPGGAMAVPYRTRMWLARRDSSTPPGL
jgi:SAM-dependent methyltransferase